MDPAQILTILKVAVGFGLVIFLHELGHFLSAKRNGVLVERFSIGFDFFGLRLARFVRGETEYVIGAFPLGGYVKMLGHNEVSPDLEDASATDPRSYQAKPLWARVEIISAGVIANFLSAFAFIWLAFQFGYHDHPPEVGPLSYSSLSAGLRPGDAILSVDGKDVDSWEQVFLRYATLEPGSTAHVWLERDGTPYEVDLPVHRDSWSPVNTPDFEAAIEPRVGAMEMGSAADEGGIEPGDQLLAVDGIPVRHWAHFTRLIQRRPDRAVPLTVARGKEGEAPAVLELVVKPRSKRPDMAPRWSAGFEPDWPPVVTWVDPDSPGGRAGLRAGDVIVAVGDREVVSWPQAWRVAHYVVPEGRPVALKVRRDGAELDVAVTAGPVPDWGLGLEAMADLGLASQRPEPTRVGAIAPGSPAEAAGLQTGDELVSLAGVYDPGNGTPLTYETEDPVWWQVLSLLGKLHAEEGETRKLTLEVRRGDKVNKIDVPVVADDEELSIGFLGVGPTSKERLRKLGPIDALGPTLLGPFQLFREFVDGIQAMALRRASPKLISGPIGILQATYQFARKSSGDLFYFLALLSVNLALVNFLPIPITDGGHFVFLMYERWKGKRMDEDLEARFQWAGLVVILMLFVYATFNDVGRLFGF